MAALCFAALASAGQTPKPMLYTGPMHSVKPVTIQKVMMLGGRVIPMGPVKRYRESNHRAMRNGNLIFDAYEGDNGSPDDAPTDGLYGETFIPEQPGARWYMGETWTNPFFARRFEQVFPGQAGKDALGFDFVMYNNDAPNTESVTEVLVFTSDDGFDPLNPVAPANFNQGVKLTYNPIAPGSAIFSNVDLTDAPLTMPANGNGWYSMIIASGDDVDGNPIEAQWAQPMLWGTKAHNPSVVSQYAFQDGLGDGTGMDGTLNTAYDWTQGVYSYPSSYTVTRGTEVGTHDVTKLTGTAGQSVVVKQAFQSSISANNAEIDCDITLDPGTPTTDLRLLRAVVRVKANALPLNDSTAGLKVYLFNYTTNSFTQVESVKPTNPSGDGTLIVCPSIAIDQIPNYISNGHCRLKVGVTHKHPVLIGWQMTVNQASVDVSQVGPDPLAEGCAFSTPN